MPRRNQGPRLRWLEKRACFYVVWTERGRSRECSTGTPDREQAEIFLAQWLQRRGRRAGPSDPAQVLVTDVLEDYQQHRGPKVVAPDRIPFAGLGLTDFFEGNSVADVTPITCGRYTTGIGSAPGRNQPRAPQWPTDPARRGRASRAPRAQGPLAKP